MISNKGLASVCRKVCKAANDGYGEFTVNVESGPEVNDDTLSITYRKQVNPGEWDTQQLRLLTPKDQYVKLVLKEVEKAK